MERGKVCPVLVGAIDRGVHRNSPVNIPRGVNLGEQQLMDPVPDPVRSEPAVTFPHCLPRPELLRQVPPCDPTTVAVSNAFYDLAVITERAPALAVGTRQQRFNTGPLIICKNLKTRHLPS